MKQTIIEERVENQKQGPTTSFRSGLIEASIWEHQVEKDGQTYTTRNVTIERRYKDKTGTWQSTNTYGLADLQRLRHVLRKAEDHLLTTQNEGR